MSQQLSDPGQVVAEARFSNTGDFIYTEADFQTIAALIHAHAGIVLTHDKAMLVFLRFTRLMRQKQLLSFADYIELISKDPVERRCAIEALTTNHTHFFREDHHFYHFKDQVRPKLVDQLNAGGRVRLWSAGTSSGEEAYSLAMAMLGTNTVSVNRILGGDLAILATDLAQHVLDVAAKGQYPLKNQPDIPAPLAQLWTKAVGDNFEVDRRIRNLVRFRRLNLLDPWPIQHRFDAIFCRNVMIYFNEPTNAVLVGRLAEQLVEGGYLYIGHSERIPASVAERFASVGQTIFRKIG